MKHEQKAKAAEKLYSKEEFHACKRKRFFRTKKIAKEFAKTLRGSYSKQIPYKCKYCEFWHLTKKKKKTKQK